MRWVFGLIIVSNAHLPIVAQNMTFDLRQQTEEAQVVLVADIFSVQEVGKAEVRVGDKVLPADVFDAELHVDRILKGTNVQPRPVVRFTVPISPAGWVGYTNLDALTYRILFLKRAEDHFELANPSVAPLPAVKGSPQSKTADALESVLSELGAVLDSVHIFEQEKLGVIYRLGSTSEPAVIDILRPQLTNTSAAIRAAIASALLQQKYLPALQEAQNLLMAPPASVPSYLLVNLSSAVARYVTDDRAIPTLCVLLGAPDVETRRAAANALRNTRSPNAVSGLARALRDTDSEVQFYGVIGLAEITSQSEWRPLREEFKKNGRKYVDYWIQWTTAHLPQVS
jgi:hypothetical protein